MFRQKPQLPVDHLLGNMEDEDGNSPPTDWVVQHQEYLTSVYASARRHLEEAAAERRRGDPDTEPVLQPGTLVYCKNHFQGRHKIQDIWGSVNMRSLNAWTKLALSIKSGLMGRRASLGSCIAQSSNWCPVVKTHLVHRHQQLHHPIMVSRGNKRTLTP